MNGTSQRDFMRRGSERTGRSGKNSWVKLAAVLVIPLITGCCGFDLSSGYDPSPEVNFRYFWKTFNEEYSMFRTKGIDWKDVGDRNEIRIRPDMSEEELAGVFADMLAVLDDGHVRMSTPHFGIESSKLASAKTWFSTGIVRSYLSDPRDYGNEHFLAGRLKADQETGYIHIRSFVPEGETGMMAGHSAWAEDIDAILASFSDVKALMIDLRNNGGGLMQDVAYIAGRFYSKAETYAVLIEKNGPGPDDFSAPVELVIHPSGKPAPAVPIIVLTNEASMSAAEFMALALKRLPGTILAGSRSSGSFSFRTARELPNGWTFTVSIQQVTTPEGVSYESTGIIPEPAWRTANTEASFIAGTDPQLELATANLKKM